MHSVSSLCQWIKVNACKGKVQSFLPNSEGAVFYCTGYTQLIFLQLATLIDESHIRLTVFFVNDKIVTLNEVKKKSKHPNNTE